MAYVNCYHVFFLAVFLISPFIAGITAIQCLICAPVPEIGETCANPKDISLDECGSTTNACHALFIKQANGATEITRNCGKYRGAFQAGDNECKDFTLSNHKTVKLCNCQSEGCNSQVLDPRELPAGPGSGAVTSAPSVAGGGSKPGTTDTNNKLPVFNPSQASVDGGGGAAKAAALTFTPFSSLITTAALFLLL
ncbi:hypothetical protein BV898_02496 [Hypsibius exemplaris]|uniref:Uncharacterized protein n=1 Tax=Hypsibius exemplaris TaxID=2072580 RepID=A0A1W0X8B2_HYPEX|nr:hypothetical protein BV898_02496 [Hypsibius exemplaris]